MPRRIWIALGLLSTAGVVGLFISHVLAGSQTNQQLVQNPVSAAGSPTHQQLVQNPTPAALASVWPNDKTWNWSFGLPPATTGNGEISLKIREKSTDTSKDEPPVVRPQTQAMLPAQANREFGTGGIGWLDAQPRPPEGRITIQLLDLSAIGAVSDHPGQNLRILATLSLGGGSVPLFGKDIYLPSGSFAGNVVAGSGGWLNNELYLMTFYVQGDQKRFQYDVFLKAQPSSIVANPAR